VAEFTHDLAVTLEINRCYDCGRHWAVEKGWRGRCPHCAQTRIDELFEERQAAHRAANALRGVITRMRRHG
jgi:hypothetical protein